ncbi:hypothetical protein Tco_1164293 [Tanacetum coccineum]
MDLNRLVMKRFKDNTPEGYNLLLLGDLKKLYEDCGVYSLMMDGTLTCFNMLVEKRYPLIKEMLKKMLNWKLEVEAESTMAFELLKFIKVMSTSTHPIIILSDFDVEDVFSSTNVPDYTPASPDYSPASLGNTSSDPSEDSSKDRSASLIISLSYDDPYMKVMQAYNATSNESPIPLPQAPITPPPIFPSSPV